MPSKLPQFTIRAPKETLYKIGIIAKKENRSTNQEIINLIENKINAYESINGKIEIDSEEK